MYRRKSLKHLFQKSLLKPAMVPMLTLVAFAFLSAAAHLLITPGWTTPVPMFIDAIPGGDDGTPPYTMSFRVDFVSASNISIIDSLKAIIIGITNLASTDFRNTHQQNIFLNKFGVIVEKVEQGFYADAILKLQKDVLKKTDGCAMKGEPDRNDWITSCGAQFEAYKNILKAIKDLQELM